MKCCNSAFNAQGSRVIVTVVPVKSSEKYMEQQWRCSGKRKDRMKLSFTTKIDSFLSFPNIFTFLSNLNSQI
jgi:hypothetical protein